MPFAVAVSTREASRHWYRPLHRFTALHCINSHRQPKVWAAHHVRPISRLKQGRCFSDARVDTPINAVTPSLSYQLTQALQLKTYSDAEIGEAFDRADSNGNGVLEPTELQALLGEIDIKELCVLLKIPDHEAECIPKTAFVQGVGGLADHLDSRIYPIACSLMLTGFSIGVFGPALPLLISDFGITTTQIGLMTTGFGITKMLGNIPFGVAADKYGRQPVIVFGCVAITLGTLSVAIAPLCSSWLPLLAGRCINGAGVAALITGAFVAAADISTPRNRARTMAPITAGFNFGNAFGPFLGGISIGTFGLAPALLSCSALLGVNSIISLRLITETRPPSVITTRGFIEAHKASIASWKPLLQRAQIRQATLYQAMFWGVFGAGFMSCVPVVLGPAKLGLAATSLGLVYGGIAATNVLAAQPLAVMTDRLGKLPAMVGGMGLMGVSFVGLSLCTDVFTLSLALGGWALSSTLLFNVPQAITADITTEQERSNALAMVRTLGDAGLVFGGIGASLLGSGCSTETVLAICGGACMVTSLSSAARIMTSAAQKQS